MNALLVVAAAAIAYLILLMAKPFLVAIAWAAVLAIIIEPVHRRFERLTKSPGVAAGLACALAVLGVLVPAGLITYGVVNEVIGFLKRNQLSGADDISRWLSAQADAATVWISQHFGVEDV